MRDHSKKLAFILVLSAHAAAFYLVERSLKLQHTARPQTNIPPLLVSFLTLTPPAPPAPRASAGPSADQRRRGERAPVSATAPQPPVAAPPPAPSSAITDWREQGAQAARDIAAGAKRPSKPFAHEFAPAPERPETGVFGPKNEHPAGTVEQMDGAERHWVTDQCYYDFERLPAPKEMPGPKTMSLHCKPPATGGTDMFKKLRPGYLTPPQAPPQDAIKAH